MVSTKQKIIKETRVCLLGEKLLFLLVSVERTPPPFRFRCRSQSLLALSSSLSIPPPPHFPVNLQSFPQGLAFRSTTTHLIIIGFQELFQPFGFSGRNLTLLLLSFHECHNCILQYNTHFLYDNYCLS